MPQMAPILWLPLFMALFSLTYFLMNFLFFTWAPQEKSETIISRTFANFHWKW
uniref:ATP synthase F0 subunit 8 n=1 Tax=Pseudoniphargus mateusorum TaxID=2211517 RepID=A0A345UDS7_9CRUS|nr:ATP synthase F0 subunit 8 [Pseudoniphargus mateusorum]